ncbi:MAG: AEC family transporter [Saccharofermentanales bacterium]
MNEIILVILKVLPVILILLLGFWMKKTAFTSADIIRGMTKITMNISLPCILFITFFNAELKPELLILSAVIFAACSLELALGFLVKKLRKSPNQFYPSLFTAFLTGPIGYPLFIAYFGAMNLYKLAILDVGNSFFIFTVLTVFLSTVSCNVNKTEKRNISVYLKNLLKSPLAISMFLGIIVSLSGFRNVIENFPVTATLLETVSLMASAAFPMILLIIGYELPFSFRNFKKLSQQFLLG